MFDNDVLLLVSFKYGGYGGRPVVLNLYIVQRCLNHRLDLSDSSPSLFYSLVCDVPCMALVMAWAALY